MKNIFLLLLLFAINKACSAQRIYICKSHKQNGEPIGQLTTGYWSAKFAGSDMEILCTLDKNKRFKKGLVLYFMVEELAENGKYEIVLNSNDYEVGPDTYWAVWKNPPAINFSGHYRISAIITGGNIIERIMIAVTYFYFADENSEWNPAQKDNLPYTDYKDAGITIGKSIDTIEGFVPESEVGYYTKQKNQNVVTMGFVIRTGKIMRTNSLHVYFYHDEEGTYQPVDTMDFYVMPLRDWAGFYCNFQQPGNYKLKIFNDANVFIKEYDFGIKEF